MSELALECRDVRKRFGLTDALCGVSLHVEPGELVGLLGPNGAGKSTLVKGAMGLVRFDGGEARVCGSPAGSIPALGGTGYLAELFRFPGWLKADELLAFHQRLTESGGGAPERGELLDLVGLGDAAGTKVDAMSKGMQQRLGIAQALVGSPSTLILDEPTSALDPVGRRMVRELLVELRERGVGVLLNSHLLSEVELVCDRVSILLKGSVVREGRPSALAQPRGVAVQTDEGARTFEGVSREQVPGLVSDLVAAGRSVYEVRLLSSTLEDAYLEAVEGASA